MCEHQYFLEYVLGYRSPSNKKADKGTIVHKVLEILAYVKLNTQNNTETFTDDIVGLVNIKSYNLDTIIEQVYNFYTSRCTHHEWDIKDYKDCHKWVHKALDYNNGMFDPRNSNVLCPEQHFDFEIQKPWAKYSYQTKEGLIEGNLALKGTIDLITLISDDTIEIVDYKTGRRLDWATGQEKTLEKLQNDPQLRMYHYAIQHLYPHIENVMVSINFINDGGAFSICFDKKDLIITENMLRQKFETIKSSQRPKLNRTWKCSKLCHFGKSTFENSHMFPIVEYREGQVCSTDKTMTKCEQVKHDIEMKGIENVVDEYTMPGYTVGKYQAPGSTE